MNRTSDLTPSALLHDFRLLVIGFVALRLLLIVTYQPLFAEGIERGLTAGGDFFTYFLLGNFAEQGLLPFRDYWSEFPPIPSLINSVLAVVTMRSGYAGFALLYGLLMVACDTGNLALIRRIGGRLHGEAAGMALAWVYAIMAAPLVFVWWNFEPLVALLLLLGLRALLEGQTTRSAVWAAVGALTKFTPALLIGAVWRFRPARTGARYTATVLVIFGVVYGLLFLQNAPMTMPSLTAQFSKASYQTVWALIDGNYRTGNFGALQERLDPANAAVLNGNPAVVPGWLRLAVGLGVGAFVFWRTRRLDDKGLAAFVLITLLIFFLQAQGWSPQWLAQILPLLLLCFPTRDGILIGILLSAVTFVEYPFLWLRTGDSGGVMAGVLLPAYITLVLARTGILIALCVMAYQRLRQHPAPVV